MHNTLALFSFPQPLYGDRILIIVHPYH
jgi:hypothetical protein